MRSFYYPLCLLIIATVAMFLDGCCDQRRPDCPQEGVGGGQDNVTIDMPFDENYTAQCVQGANGSYSHMYTSTQYDADFDTPNNQRDPVYAPVDGMAYVHDGNRTSGFGEHINIDMDDGTYIILGHLDDIFVDNMSEVAAGQLLAFEGTTGASTGDHVHVGRHDGDASADGGEGTSIEGLSLNVMDTTMGGTATLATTALTCDLSSGHYYASRLTTPRWHPNGSLVKTPDQSTVYLVDGGNLRAFVDEDSFWSRGYDFDEVALVSDEEVDCYGAGATIMGQNDITAVYDNGAVWLVFANDSERQRVASTGWQGVLKSWGVVAATYDDLPAADTVPSFADSAEAGMARFRDGSLVSEATSSTVYVMSDGVAMPVETWDVYLLLGFENRMVIEVDDGVVDAVMGAVGDCATNAYCVSRDDVVTCGGPSADDEGSYPERVEDTGYGGDVDVTSGDGGSGGSDTTFGSDGLSVTWTTSSGAGADRITLSGEYVHSSGWSEGWQTLASVSGLASLTYEVVDVSPGDALRFSVEFVDNGVTSWSCVAPYPPGVVQGSVAATYRGNTLSVATADDPSSDGCGLLVTVP